jgi:cell division protein FtsQ
VYRADVRRQGLGSVAIDIDEQVPVARWGNEGERGFSVWLNRDGDTFEVADSSLPKDTVALPVMHGPLDTGNDLMARYMRYSQLLAPSGRTIRQLDLSPRLSWSMRLDNGTRVELGRERTLNSADELVALFVQLYPQLVGNRSVPPTVVDLRYPAGVAVRYPAGATTSSSTPSDRKGKS